MNTKSCSKSYFHPCSHAYLCEQKFSVLVEIKPKKRNLIKDVDTLVRGALETRLLPRFSQLADEIQRQRPH